MSTSSQVESDNADAGVDLDAGNPAAPAGASEEHDAGANAPRGGQLAASDDLLAQLEGLLFVTDEPLAIDLLAELLEAETDAVAAAVEELESRNGAPGRGTVVREVGGGWRLYTSDAAAPAVERFVLAGRTGRLTRAALEALAVVAYKQPLSRSDVSEIRGVNSDGAIRTLTVRGLVEEVGRDDGPGQAFLYGTTSTFLEKLGLTDLSELPALTDYLPEAPAPDEPAAGDLPAARARIAGGDDLPSTGASRWDPSGGEQGLLVDPDGEADEEVADEATAQLTAEQEAAEEADRAARAARRKAEEDEMDQLTDALERVARSAMDQLKTVVRSEEADRVDPDDPGPPAEGQGTAEPGQQNDQAVERPVDKAMGGSDDEALDGPDDDGTSA